MCTHAQEHSMQKEDLTIGGQGNPSGNFCVLDVGSAQ